MGIPTDSKLLDLEAPSGTVTFLFTDIEGSTKLLERLREEYAVLLDEQRQILRAAFTRWNGREMDTQGDSFFTVFPRAIDAICCVIEAQRELTAHKWPQHVVVRVRMGLHTGEPIQVRTGYVGMDVHRAARIAAAGHGGQVLVSQTTRDLVFQDLPKGASLRDLGEHKLKDIRYPQQIYQLDIEGLLAEYPPLKTLSTEEEPPTPGEPPYRGLQFFDEADAEWFFGREQITGKLVKAVKEQRFLAIVGASGSGKSSVVRAGLIPGLKRSQPGRWDAHIITPSSRPLESLAVSLTKREQSVAAAATLIDDLRRDPRSLHLYVRRMTPNDRRVTTLLVVDQFEELFTLCRDEQERQAFVENLLYAVEVEGDHSQIVIALRADFYQHLAQYAGLRTEIAKHQEYLGGMDSAELHQAIEEPARRGGWEFSPGLVELMLHDIGATEGRQAEPGALPLLSHALLETWKRRRGNLMNLRAYSEAGGVRGAIAKTAESVYFGELTPQQQDIARNIFLRLTELGEGTQDTRRRAKISELVPPAPYGNPKQVEEVLVILADARLITTGEGTAEVAHEALIREWPTLRKWLSEDREGLLVHRHLTEAAQEWELLEHDPGALYRGARLAQAAEWFAANPQHLNSQEKAFLDASLEASQREEAEKEAQRQRELHAAQMLAEAEKQRAEEQTNAAARLRQRALYLTIAVILVGILAVAAVLLARQAGLNAQVAQTAEAIAVQERQKAEEQASLARSRELAAAAANNLDIDPERSVLLALQAYSTTHTLEAVNALHQALPELHIMHTIPAHRMTPGLSLHPDGTRFASLGVDGEAKVWDASNFSLLLTLPGEPGEFGNTILYSPDGKHLAVSYLTRVTIWDAISGKKLFSLMGDTSGPQISYMAFSPDGNLLAVANMDGIPKVWDVNERKLAFSLVGHATFCDGIAFSPKGNILATGDESGIVKVWDAQSGHELNSFNQGGLIHSIAFSPDGDHLAVSSEDGYLRVWDPTTGEEQLTLPRMTGIYNVVYTSDGLRLVTAHHDGSINIWDTQTGVRILSLAGHVTTVLGLAVTHDGNRIVSSGYEGTVKIWDATPGREVRTITSKSGLLYDAVYSPDGKQIVSVGADGIADIWDAETGQKLFSLTQDEPVGELGGVAFSPDGRYLASSSLNGTVQIWDLHEQRSVQKLAGHNGPVWGVSFTKDGQYVATASWDGTAKVWDFQSGTEIFSLPGHGMNTLMGAAFSPDGKRIFTGGVGNAHEWDASTGKELQKFQGEGQEVYGIAVSPDGRHLAAGWEDGWITLWDLSTGEKLQEFSAHNGLIPRLAFSPDGTRLASAGFDKYARIWDVASGQELATLYGNSSNVFDVSFSPDGRHLLTAGGDGMARIYTLDVNDLIALARSRLTRALTPQECQQYLHTAQCPEP
jgi:WD40 repeat protein/class 3 adenylate cyclase/energy-coupling factor transporter ATP-binding protein EcfA2